MSRRPKYVPAPTQLCLGVASVLGILIAERYGAFMRWTLKDPTSGERIATLKSCLDASPNDLLVEARLTLPKARAIYPVTNLSDEGVLCYELI